MLIGSQVDAALLPRPWFWQKKRLQENRLWPEVVDDRSGHDRDHREFTTRARGSLPFSTPTARTFVTSNKPRRFIGADTRFGHYPRSRQKPMTIILFCSTTDDD
jgi:hypothetical protein